MGIEKAIRDAFNYASTKKYPKLYVAVDLHGTCFKSTYESGGYALVNKECKDALQHLANRDDVVLILWSSCHPAEQKDIIAFFETQGIHIDYFNENPECANTKTGCFDTKFYFSILIDDKAGFDYEYDWLTVKNEFMIR